MGWNAASAPGFRSVFVAIAVKRAPVITKVPPAGGPFGLEGADLQEASLWSMVFRRPIGEGLYSLTQTAFVIISLPTPIWPGAGVRGKAVLYCGPPCRGGPCSQMFAVSPSQQFVSQEDGRYFRRIEVHGYSVGRISGDS